jgi:hypothetical protein
MCTSFTRPYGRVFSLPALRASDGVNCNRMPEMRPSQLAGESDHACAAPQPNPEK